jgi:hypothetical protein
LFPSFLSRALYRSSFSAHLASSITLSRRTFRNEITTYTLVAGDDLLIEVFDCHFATHGQVNGGAINILNQGSVLRISRTVFSECSASYRGGAISFFGAHFSLDSVCFYLCEAGDAGLAVESHLDPDSSDVQLRNIEIIQCGGPEQFYSARAASLYLILGAQHGRVINSTLNDASWGGSFATTEDSAGFNFEYVLCHNNSGRSTFEFEDLTSADVFSHVNVLSCTGAQDGFDAGYSIFVLTGSVLTLERSAIFYCPATYLVTNGELTFAKVYTDLGPSPPTQSAVFRSLHSYHSLDYLRTAKLRGMVPLDCHYWDGVDRTPTARRPSFEYAVPGEGDGIVTFLAIASAAGLALLCYYVVGRRPHRLGRSAAT